MKKVKKILIVYGSNHNSKAVGEYIFNKLISDFGKREDLEDFVANHKTSIAKINGNKIYLMRIGSDFKGMRVTDLYIEDSIRNIVNGEKYIEGLIPCVIQSSSDYENYDVSDSIDERIKVFELDNNIVDIRNFK